MTGRVLHNRDTATCQPLLARVRERLPVGGLLLEYEAFVDEDRHAAAHALLSSLNMLLATEGGADFTATECGQWLSEAGFAVEQTRLVAGHLSAPVARHVAGAGDRHA